MPIALLRPTAPPGFLPLLDLPVRLGSDPRCDLVDPSPGVAPLHAEVRYTRGEYLLMPQGDAQVFVGGAPVPLWTLQHGDEVQFGPTGAPWTFRNGLQGCFRPPEASLTEAWLAVPGSRDPAQGSGAYEGGQAVGGRDGARCRRVETPAGPCLVKRFGTLRGPADGDEHLRLLARWGGAAHAALAPLVDGGIEVVGEACERWAVTRWVEGRPAREAIEAGGVEPAAALRILQDLAAGLAHLHRRGVVHRDVAPGNVILRPEGGAVLIDFGQAVLTDGHTRSSAGVVGTPGYVAPEEVLAGREAVSPAVDLYGLGAVGYALLTGFPPASGEDVLATLGRSTQPPPPLQDYGITVPDVLETTLLQCLAPDPAQRQDAASVVAALTFAGAQVGLGGHP